MKTAYDTRGTCARRIEVEIENGVITRVAFSGGCDGNLQALSRLVEGQNAREAMDKLRGIDCGGRGTSCPDQLSLAIEANLAAGA